MQRPITLRKYAFVVLVAFLANAILPFFALYNPPATHEGIQRLASVFGDKILLCTGDGFKWVKLADLQSGKENPKPYHGYECPLCYAASHGLKSMAVAAVAIPHRDNQVYTPFFAYNSPSLSFHLASSAHVRAPPVSFIG